MRLMINLPKDFVLIISGVSCVGKTTTAYNLLKEYPEFKRVTELDIIRTVLRSTIKDVANTISYTEQKRLLENFDYLFSSSTNEDFFILKEQSKILVKSIKEIVKRQQERKIPTIIEGSSIVPSVFFQNNKPIAGFEKNVLFINLFLSDENKHFLRREKRCSEREYTDSIEAIHQKVICIRNNKNDMLHEETVSLSLHTNNVVSVDVSHLDEKMVICKIVNIIQNYLNCCKD